MIPALIRMALSQRWLVLALAGALVALGVWAFQNQQIDAYPDISGQMVEVITTYPGRAPEEVEQQVTIPIEIAMRTVPRVDKIRSRTIFGLSIVDVLFSEGVENYWARQRVQEQLGNATLPPNVQPNLAPLATAYGEIFRYELVAKDGVCDQMELRTLQDWVVVPRIFKCDGVADVANFGGHLKQYTVTFIPAQLQRNNLALSDVINALQSNNSSAGGSVLARGSMSFVIRGKGTVRDIAEIGAIFIKSVGGVPIYLRDVAVVELDYPPPTGIFSKDHHDESIEGIVVMRRGENPSQVLARVQAAVVELDSGLLPQGVRVKDFYDRTLLIQNTLHTVAHSVTLGITLVVLVLLLFLGRPSMAALVALTIPFALLVAMLLMYVTSIPIGLLSVGAIDFGIIVDGAVIMAENIAAPPGRRGPGTDATEREEDRAGRHLGSRAARLLLRADDHRRIFAPAFAGEHRGTAVPAHGPHARFRAAGGPVLRLVRGARAGHVSFSPRLPRMGESAPALVPPGLLGLPAPVAPGAVGRGRGCGPVAGGGLCPRATPVGHRVPPLHGRGRDLGPRQFP